ncbi:hypothetical protein ACE1TI_18945 [Alteribacillus sp. JSM 102045]|uniref:hypothetical protein n=1 Tax=Alteribacillus sp. JSM 102045 TaxID=1562101 RepID=UPI0035BFB083
MSSPVHEQKRQLQYLKQRVRLIQEMIEQMEQAESHDRTELKRLDEMLAQIRRKITQFKQDWDGEER